MAKPTAFLKEIIHNTIKAKINLFIYIGVSIRNINFAWNMYVIIMLLSKKP